MTGRNPRVLDFGRPPHEYDDMVKWAFGVDRCPNGKAVAYIWNVLHGDLFKIPPSKYGDQRYLRKIGQAYAKHIKEQ